MYLSYLLKSTHLCILLFKAYLDQVLDPFFKANLSIYLLLRRRDLLSLLKFCLEPHETFLFSAHENVLLLYFVQSNVDKRHTGIALRVAHCRAQKYTLWLRN